MEEAEFRAKMAQIMRQLVSTSVPIVPSYLNKRSGLIVPSRTAQPSPLDHVKLYITAEEVFGVAPSMNWVERQLQDISLDDVLRFVATWLHELHRSGADVRRVDSLAADTWFEPGTREKVKDLCQRGGRTLVTPQALFVLAKMACSAAADASAEVNPAILVGGLLAISQHLGLSRENGAADPSLGLVGQELIANQLFNRNPSQANIIASFVRRWLQLPCELAGEARVIDLADAFQQATGVSLTDLQIIGTALWSSSLKDQRSLIPPEYFEPLGWSRERLAATLDLICVDATRLRVEVADEISRFGLPWSISAFERFPVIRLDSGSLLVIDPNLLVRRAFGWLPLFDIVEGLKSRGQPGDRRLAEHAKGCVAHLTEVYTLEVLSNIVGNGNGNHAQRLYNDTDLDAAFTKRGRQKADAAIDYGDAWVVVEVTTSKAQRATVSGISSNAVDADLGKLVDEAAQIEATIDALRIDESRLTGVPSQRARRYLPLLVASEGFPINPISLELLRERLRTAGVLQKSDISSLEVVDLEELEIVESLQEYGGPSLRDLLTQKAASSMANAGMREYILSSVNGSIKSASRIRQLMRVVIEPAAVALGSQSFG